MPFPFIPAGKLTQVLAWGIVFCALAARADEFSATVKDSSSDTETESAKPSAPASTTDVSASQKAAETPHFWQRDPRGEFENGGRDYCCPVAVSNSFCYLAHHGFPALLSDGEGV
jgi:hypothetical protein